MYFIPFYNKVSLDLLSFVFYTCKLNTDCEVNQLYLEESSENRVEYTE